ncbi:MAG TPA: SDR family NAD(P)-dependent oxidoreductase, partial [Chitinophagaceae bacterium]|nr:SDR family NAD(P)-dependent oxidoreductase [Chitinophagaceae bacterium]
MSFTKTVLITGATSGFGKAAAEKFAQHNYRVIITGRRKERLDALAGSLKEKYGAAVHCLAFDVRHHELTEAAIQSLGEEWQPGILVNNAGLALGRDYFEEASMDDWETMIDTNVKGFLYVAKAVSKLMIKKGGGHIINIGSIAGKQVYEKGNVYCATKHAVDALNQAMRIDLLPNQIQVTGIHTGAAETEFSLVPFKGDAATAN